VVDCSDLILRPDSGVFASLRDPAEFAKVYVNPESRTVTWPNDLDLDPDVLYAKAHSIPIPVAESAVGYLERDYGLPPGMPFPEVTAVAVLPPYGLHLTFEDGTSGVVDGSRWLWGEHVGWPGDLDICPDTLYALAHGIPLPGID
jgi:hypothetical protein